MMWRCVLVGAFALTGCGAGEPSASGSKRPADQPYPPTGVTKTFALTIEEHQRWEVATGAIYDALTYNRRIPGPPIEVNAGDHVSIELRNEASTPHSIHTHVTEFTYENDGVDPPSLVPPGETRTIEWDAVFAGTFPYHDHGHESEGVVRGLVGAVIVHAPDEAKAAEQVVVLGDLDPSAYLQLPGVADPATGVIPDAGIYRGGHQYMHAINGKAYEDAIPPFRAKIGDRVRWRIVSLGQEFHTWHVHGHRWIGSDGALTDNILLGPGSYATFEYSEDKAGDWLVHCHVPAHMEGGMTARYVVEP